MRTCFRFAPNETMVMAEKSPTRMHSSRIRTIRCSGHGGRVSAQGVSAQGGCLHRGCLPGGVCHGGVCPGVSAREVSARGYLAGGVYPGSVCPAGSVSQYTLGRRGGVCPVHAWIHLPVDRILDIRLWKHYLSTTTLRTVKIVVSTFYSRFIGPIRQHLLPNWFARWTSWSDQVKFGTLEPGMCRAGSCRRLWTRPTNLDVTAGFLCRYGIIHTKWQLRPNKQKNSLMFAISLCECDFGFFFEKTLEQMS